MKTRLWRVFFVLAKIFSVLDIDKGLQMLYNNIISACKVKANTPLGRKWPRKAETKDEKRKSCRFRRTLV